MHSISIYYFFVLCRYDQVWDPELKRKNGDKSSNEKINLFLDLIESRQKELGMLALHEANYDVNEAKRLFSVKLYQQKDDRYEPWSFEEAEAFHNAMLSSEVTGQIYTITDKNSKGRKPLKVGFLKFLSESCKRSPLACMLYYYNTYKGSIAENEFERLVHDKQDFCTVCGKDGLLICCDGCYRPYHLYCTDPPLSKLPEAEQKWFCKLCDQDMIAT